MDERAPRKGGPWPFLAIALLVVLLSAFLFLQWSRQDAPPTTVKLPPVPAPPPTEPEPPPPAPEPAPPAPEPPPEPGPPAPPPPAPPPAPDPQEGKFKDLLETARKAVEEKRWEDALAALEAARAFKDDPAAIGPLREAVLRGRRDEEAAARRKFEAVFAALKERIEKLKLDSLYDAAMEDLARFEKENPAAPTDEPFQRLRRDMAELRKDADTAYLKSMGEARRALEEGRFPQALVSAERAAKLYPERREEVAKFQEQVRARLMQEQMVRIPEADYWIGCDDERYPDERPFRRVRLPAFHIDKYEVTNEEYHAFVLATGLRPPPYWPRDGKPPRGRERHPVVVVTWEDASRYAAWAGKRLPTAEEWEAAARGPGPQPYIYPWGNSFTEKENVFLCNSWEHWQANRGSGSIPGTTPVDEPPNAPSPFGVYGMGGNVWEWTSTVVKRKAGDREVEFRVLKGGSFTTYQRAIRASNLYPEDPASAHPDVGFRCVRDAR